MSKVVESRIHHDPDHVAGLVPEPVKRPVGQRSVPSFAGKHPLPGSSVGESVEQFSRHPRPAERTLARAWRQSRRAGPA